MIHRVVRAGDWMADFLFAFPKNDREGVIACLQSYGAPDSIVQDAAQLMDSGPNCGFTFSNGCRHESLTWVGLQSNGTEWLNTTVHEIVHVAMAVAMDEGIDPFSEDLAYLIGRITQDLSDIICHLSCDYCREEKNH